MINPVLRMRRTRPNLRTTIREYALLCALFVLPSRLRARAFFEMRSMRNSLTESSLYRNMGYWADDPTTLDDACEAMAALLGGAAGIGPGDEVLDVGFGFAEQDMYWARTFEPDRIVGIDLMPGQVTTARDRVGRLGFAGRIELRQGSATELPFPDGAFDKVLSLESALHFVTRDDFFREAYRVLRPNGRLTLVDPVSAPRRKDGRIGGYVHRALGAIPKENIYSTAEYADRLRRAGFTDVTVRSIRDDVYPPFARYLRRRLHDPDVAVRINRVIAMMWHAWSSIWTADNDNSGYLSTEDYILVVAEKGSSTKGPTVSDGN